MTELSVFAMIGFKGDLRASKDRYESIYFLDSHPPLPHIGILADIVSNLFVSYIAD